MQMLVDKGAEVNKADDDGLTPLHRSARKGNVEMVSLLVANGADLNVKDRWVGGFFHRCGCRCRCRCCCCSRCYCSYNHVYPPIQGSLNLQMSYSLNEN